MPAINKHRFIALPLAGVALAVLLLSCGGCSTDWRTASREPAGFAPDPATTPEAVVQVYSARAVSWRGWFGVHTWVAVKRADTSAFTVHEVMGWQLRRTGTAVVARQRTPDGYWYGKKPELLADLRGPGVEQIIDRVEAAARDYPYADRYHVADRKYKPADRKYKPPLQRRPVRVTGRMVSPNLPPTALAR